MADCTLPHTHLPRQRILTARPVAYRYEHISAVVWKAIYM